MKHVLRSAVALLTAISAFTAVVGVGAASAAQTGLVPVAALTSTRVSPGPDCANNGNSNPCWEYQTWFWTFDNCNNYFNEHGYDPSRYDNHICAVFTNGATVGLWLHKYNG